MRDDIPAGRRIVVEVDGLIEAQYDDLLNFKSSGRYDDRQKATLACAGAIAWEQAATSCGSDCTVTSPSRNW